MRYQSYEPSRPPRKHLAIHSRRGIKYVRSVYDGGWFVCYEDDRPNKFVGAEHELPNEILVKLKKLELKGEA